MSAAGFEERDLDASVWDDLRLTGLDVPPLHGTDELGMVPVPARNLLWQALWSAVTAVARVYAYYGSGLGDAVLEASERHADELRKQLRGMSEAEIRSAQVSSRRIAELRAEREANDAAR
jgi:hypothetical protein